MWLFQTKTRRSPYFHSSQMIFSEPREADSRCLGVLCIYSRHGCDPLASYIASIRTI